jgi:hypothetical protein
MYMGPSTEDAPMASPPIIRATTSEYHPMEKAQPIAEST